MNTLYTIEETARILHMTVSGMRTLRHKNRGPVGMKVGRRVMWTQQSLDRYLDQLQGDADRQRESVHATSFARSCTNNQKETR